MPAPLITFMCDQILNCHLQISSSVVIVDFIFCRVRTSEFTAFNATDFLLLQIFIFISHTTAQAEKEDFFSLMNSLN